MIRNTINGKVYIGRSARVLTRWSGHRGSLKAGKHHSCHLQRAWDKYGADAFVFDVLHWEDDLSKLPALEAYYVDLHEACSRDKGYNINIVTPTSYKASDETRAKLSAIQTALQTPEMKEQMAAKQRGIPNSAEAKAKMSAVWHATHHWTAELKARWSALRKGKPRSPEACAKTAAGLRGRTHTPEAKARMSESQKKIVTPERRAHMSDIRKAWWDAKRKANQSRTLDQIPESGAIQPDVSDPTWKEPPA